MAQELETPPELAPEKNEFEAKLKQLESTNARLLEESKKYREKNRTFEAELEAIAAEKAVGEKDVNKIIEQANKKADKIAQENKKLKAETLNSRIRNTVSKYAADVIDLEDLLNQPKYADILKRGIDVEELTVDEDAIKEYVETVLKAKPYLKKQPEATSMMTKKPGFTVNNNSKSLAEMSASEIKEMALKLYGNT